MRTSFKLDIESHRLWDGSRRKRLVYQITEAEGPLDTPKTMELVPHDEAPDDLPAPSPKEAYPSLFATQIVSRTEGLSITDLADESSLKGAAESYINSHKRALRDSQANHLDIDPSFERLEDVIADTFGDISLEDVVLNIPDWFENGLLELVYDAINDAARPKEINLERLSQETSGHIEGQMMHLQMKARNRDSFILDRVDEKFLGLPFSLDFCSETRLALEEVYWLLATLRRAVYATVVRDNPQVPLRFDPLRDYWPESSISFRDFRLAGRLETAEYVDHSGHLLDETVRWNEDAVCLAKAFYDKISYLNLDSDAFSEYRKKWLWQTDIGLLHRLQKEAEGIIEGYEQTFPIPEGLISELPVGDPGFLHVPTNSRGLRALLPDVSLF